MKFKALTATFLAATSLAACSATPSTPEELAAAQATAYDVKCYSPTGTLTFEGETRYGISPDTSSSSRNVVIETLDGRSFEQYGGHCTALKRAP